MVKKKGEDIYMVSTELKEIISCLIITIHKFFNLFIYKTRPGIQHVERVRAEVSSVACLVSACIKNSSIEVDRLSYSVMHAIYLSL